MNWQAAIVDAVSLLVLGALIYTKAVPSEIGVPLLTAVIAARAAMMKPPPGPGGGLATSAAGAMGLGVMALLGFARHR